MKDYMKDIIKRAYDKGYADGYYTRKDIDQDDNSEHYKEGLIDAWELARKISQLSFEDGVKLFGYGNPFLNYSVSEAMGNIKAFEEKQGKCVPFGSAGYMQTAEEQEKTELDFGLDYMLNKYLANIVYENVKDYTTSVCYPNDLKNKPGIRIWFNNGDTAMYYYK